MNKILQISLASVLAITNANVAKSAGAPEIVAQLQEGIKITSGTKMIIPENKCLVNSGTNTGMSGNTYNLNTSTVIDVLVGGTLAGSVTDAPQGTNNAEGGTIGTDGENDNNGITIRHHNTNWESASSNPNMYGLSAGYQSRGFISDKIKFGKNTYLQEMYDTSNLKRIYSTYTGTDDLIGAYKTILLSAKPETALEAGEHELSDISLYPGSTNNEMSIIPGTTFVIPAINGDNTIAANLSNTELYAQFANYVPSTNLKILPLADNTLTFTGSNDRFVGTIEIDGDSGQGGTVIFGNGAYATTNALGGYTAMTVKNASTVSLQGGDDLTINRNWTLYDNSKLVASQRITLSGGAMISFGVTDVNGGSNQGGTVDIGG